MPARERLVPIVEPLEDRRLLSSGSIKGMVYLDGDGNTVRTRGEGPIGNVQLYLDMDDDGALGAGDVTAVTTKKGKYVFKKLAPGIYHVRVTVPDAYASTAPPGGAYFVDTRFKHSATKRDFGFWPLAQGPVPVIGPPSTPADPNPPIPLVLYSTGVGTSIPSDGTPAQPDPYWEVSQVTPGAGPQPFNQTYPTGSSFIGPDRNGGQLYPAGDYIFATAFDLTGLESTTATITGTALAGDDHIVDIRLNGQSLGITSTAGQTVSFSAASDFIAGVNTLEVIVGNDTLSPIGLQVQSLRGFAHAVQPGPITLYNTGVSQPNGIDGTNATLLPASTVDGHWLVSTPGNGYDFYTNDSLHHFVYNNGLTSGRFGTPFVATGNTAWDTDDLNTTSAGNDSSFINPSGNGTQALLAGTYIYRTTFDLTGLDPSTAQVDGELEATAAVDVYLNGNLITHLNASPGKNSGVGFTVRGGAFVAGLNVLDFVMSNPPTGGTATAPNGLRIDRLRGNASGMSVKQTGAFPLRLPLPPFPPLDTPVGQIPTTT